LTLSRLKVWYGCISVANPVVFTARHTPVENYQKQLRVKNSCESRGFTNEEYVLTPLEDAQNAAEAFMHKEVEILYKISLLEKDDAEEFNRWVRADPRYQRMQNFKSDVRTYMGV
jgi:hypothetical protein